jgi:hypothetical protein
MRFSIPFFLLFFVIGTSNFAFCQERIYLYHQPEQGTFPYLFCEDKPMPIFAFMDSTQVHSKPYYWERSFDGGQIWENFDTTYNGINSVIHTIKPDTVWYRASTDILLNGQEIRIISEPFPTPAYERARVEIEIDTFDCTGNGGTAIFHKMDSINYVSLDFPFYGNQSPFNPEIIDSGAYWKVKFFRPGLYHYEIYDGKCASFDKVNMAAKNGPIISDTLTWGGFDCNFALKDFTIDITTTGGVAPYQYEWTDLNSGALLATTEDYFSSTSPWVNLLVTDANGCQFSGPDYGDYNKLNHIMFGAKNWENVQNVECGGNGGFYCSTLGLIPQPISYKWSNGATTSYLTHLSEGIYGLTVTYQNGCISTGSLTIQSINNLEIYVTGGVLDACIGQSAIDVEVVDFPHQGSIAYKWNTGATTEDLYQVPNGHYTVTVSLPQQPGCTAVRQFDVLATHSVQLYDLMSPLPCYEGFIDSAFALAGAEPYHYIWSTGSTSPQQEFRNSGIYTVTVTDNVGCTKILQKNIQLPDTSIPAFGKDTLCIGANDGSFTIHASNVIEKPIYFSLDGISFLSDSLFNNLSKGTFPYWVKDVNGCIQQDSFEIVETNPLVSIDIQKDSILLFPNEITTFNTSFDGIEALLFQWTPSGGLSCNDCPNPTFDAQSSNSGWFHVQVTDPYDCSQIDSIYIGLKDIGKRWYIPNAFAPLSITNNNFWSIYGSEALIKIKYVRIVSRWGEVIFEGKDLVPGSEIWNGLYRGKISNPNVFVFEAILQYNDDSEEIIFGDITIVD